MGGLLHGFAHIYRHAGLRRAQPRIYCLCGQASSKFTGALQCFWRAAFGDYRPFWAGCASLTGVCVTLAAMWWLSLIRWVGLVSDVGSGLVLEFVALRYFLDWSTAVKERMRWGCHGQIFVN